MRFLSIYNESIYIFGCGLQVKYLMDCIKYMFPIKDRIPYFMKLMPRLRTIYKNCCNISITGKSYMQLQLRANKFCPWPEHGCYILFFMFFGEQSDKFLLSPQRIHRKNSNERKY